MSKNAAKGFLTCSTRRISKWSTRSWKAVDGVLVVCAFALSFGVFVPVQASSGFRKDVFRKQLPAEEFEWCKGVDINTCPMHDYLPCSSLDLIQLAYGTDFMQEMKSGNLNPVDYSKYDLQDWYYLRHASDLYGTVCDDKPCDEDLTEFFTHYAESFGELADTYVPTYSIAPDSTVNDIMDPAPSTRGYTDFETTASAANPAQYTAVIMAPCLQIWTMLAQKMKAEGAIRDGNAYSFWVKDNYDYVSELLNRILDTQTFNKTKALEIYQEGVQHETAMFAWATQPQRADLNGKRAGAKRLPSKKILQ